MARGGSRSTSGRTQSGRSPASVRPASSSSEMNGVVFQISEKMMTNRLDHRCPNQLKSPSPNHWLTKPESSWNAYYQMYAETTVMMP